MINFQFCVPTRVVFGKDTQKNVGAEIVSEGGKKVLLHYGSERIKKDGLYDEVMASLKNANLEVFELGGVRPNPRIDTVRKGVEICKAQGIDFILAVGGGSPIDSSKAIAIGALMEGDIWNDIYLGGGAAPTKALPIGVILTFAAAGSETSNSVVISSEDGSIKRGLRCNAIRPRFALENPELTYSLPPYQTGAGTADILMHILDRYFTNEKNTEVTDRLAEGAMKAIIRAGRQVIENPSDYNARADLMWVGGLAHNDLMGLGKVNDFAVHQLGHELSAKYDVTHGASLTIAWQHWAKYVYKHDVMQFAKFAVRVMDCQMDFENPENTALEGIKRLNDWFIELGMPTSFDDAKLPKDELDDLAYHCTFFGKRTIGQLVTLKAEDILNIYKMMAGI